MPLYREKGYLSGDQWDGFLELYEVAPDNGRQYLLDSMDWMIDFYEKYVTEGMSDYEIVKTLYHAVMDNTKYNYSLINRYQSQGIDVISPSKEEREILEADPEYWLCHSWMGFANGVDVVCDGYSEAFQLLMNMAGIPCAMCVHTRKTIAKDTSGTRCSWMGSGTMWISHGRTPMGTGMPSSCEAMRPSSGMDMKSIRSIRTAGTERMRWNHL